MYGHRPGDIDLSVAFCTKVCMPNMKYHISKFNNVARIKGFIYTNWRTGQELGTPKDSFHWDRGME